MVCLGFSWFGFGMTPSWNLLGPGKPILLVILLGESRALWLGSDRESL